MDNLIEKLLQKVAPILKAVETPSKEQPSVERLANFLEKVGTRSIALKKSVILKQAEMEVIILNLINEKAMDGFDLIKFLESKHIHCEERGEGIIYGILNTLENQGVLEGRWRESSSRMVKTYYITKKGGEFLHRNSSILIPFQALLASS